MDPWVILGCGYTGGRLARSLCNDGAQVVCARRDRERAEAVASAAAAGGSGAAAGRAVDLAVAGSLAGWMPAGAVVVISAPPGEPGNEARVIEAATRAGARRVIYLSSTGVYPRGDGTAMDEDTPPAPVGDHGARRLVAETALLQAAAEAGISAIALRVAAIYGPERGVHARLLAGTYRIIGDGCTVVSRIHVDDLARAIRAAARITEPPRSIYNVADDTPMPSRALAERVAAHLGVSPPPTVSPDEVSPAAWAMLSANRAIANDRIKRELGLVLRYPEPMAGIRQALAETSRQ